VIGVAHTDIELDVKIAPLTRELNAEVIAQLVFVTKVFLKEINFILQAVYNLDQPVAIEHSKIRVKSLHGGSTSANGVYQLHQQQQAAKAPQIHVINFYFFRVQIHSHLKHPFFFPMFMTLNLYNVLTRIKCHRAVM
jgi:hypothetical protein